MYTCGITHKMYLTIKQNFKQGIKYRNL